MPTTGARLPAACDHDAAREPSSDEPQMMALTQEFFGTADPEHQTETVDVRGHP